MCETEPVGDYVSILTKRSILNSNDSSKRGRKIYREYAFTLTSLYVTRECCHRDDIRSRVSPCAIMQHLVMSKKCYFCEKHNIFFGEKIADAVYGTLKAKKKKKDDGEKFILWSLFNMC